MTIIEPSATTIQPPDGGFVIDEAQLAAVAFLARYSGRTLDAYRHDLRGFFQWAADTKLVVLSATRPHIELYRSWMEQRGLSASTIDRRLSTVCGFYRFAHIDGRIGSNPRSTCVGPRCRRTRVGAWTAPSSARSCSPPNGWTWTMTHWRCCSA
jgi:integrase